MQTRGVVWVTFHTSTPMNTTLLLCDILVFSALKSFLCHFPSLPGKILASLWQRPRSSGIWYPCYFAFSKAVHSCRKGFVVNPSRLNTDKWWSTGSGGMGAGESKLHCDAGWKKRNGKLELPFDIFKTGKDWFPSHCKLQQLNSYDKSLQSFH